MSSTIHPSNTHILTQGIQDPELSVPLEIERPEYVGKPTPAPFTGTDIPDKQTLEKISESSLIAAGALDAVSTYIKPGITTAQIDNIGHQYLIDHGAYPSTLGYRGFPKSMCTSVNEVICHGIPDSTVLQDGDIVNVDITAYKNKVHGDTNYTFLVGGVDIESRLLVARTQEALNRAIKAVKPGRQINVIGRTIEAYAKRFGYGVVRDFTGHGVGEAFHTGLIIPHYDAEPLYNDLIEVGMVFTIEPMLTLGTHQWDEWDDGWTITTADKGRTAQFEHTLVVEPDGAKILTKNNLPTYPLQ